MVKTKTAGFAARRSENLQQHQYVMFWVLVPSASK
jgi:hypothetical protein